MKRRLFYAVLGLPPAVLSRGMCRIFSGSLLPPEPFSDHPILCGFITWLVIFLVLSLVDDLKKSSKSLPGRKSEPDRRA